MDVAVRVIVLNWNGRHWLGPCLAALRHQTFRFFEVVVVDNASTDGSADWVRDEFPECQVVALGRNAGFSAGNNAGASGAKAEFLVFLNNDTCAEPGWLAALVTAVQADPSVGLAASHLVYMDAPDTVDSAGDGYLRCGGAFKREHGQPRTTSREVRETFGVCGAAFLIRRTLFERLGGFDEAWVMVYEDVDLSYRARLLGARCLFVPAAVVRHVGSASLGRISATAVFYGQRNLEWTWLKNSPWTLLLRSLPSHILYDAAGLISYARRGHGGAWLQGKMAALLGLPAIWRKRRQVQRSVRVSPGSLWALMEPDWVAVKRREKRFDFRRVQL